VTHSFWDLTFPFSLLFLLSLLFPLSQVLPVRSQKLCVPIQQQRLTNHKQVKPISKPLRLQASSTSLPFTTRLRDKQSMTRTRVTKHELGVAKVLLPFRLLRLSYPVLIGFNMKQTTLEKILCGLFLALSTSVLLVVLYYFIKAIVGFDN
jgi:hypothetical protein